MAQQRERRLVLDGAVCQDAHSYMDPDVRTAADAKAKGPKRCPIFDECMHDRVLDRRGVRCAAIFGQHIARFAIEDGSSIDEEIEAFRAEAWQEQTGGFIDPYIDPEVVIDDPDKAAEAVADWARTILYGPELITEESTVDASSEAPSAKPGRSQYYVNPFLEGVRRLRAMEEAERNPGKTNGGIVCDTISGPCSCGSWH